MNIKVNDKMIETDEEGFLLNVDEWNDKVCEALIKQHETDGHKPVSETARGLIAYFRDYYEENKVHPTMHKLVLFQGDNDASVSHQAVRCGFIFHES